MNQENHHTHTSFRRARTRTLIQLGGLFEKSGLMESFDVQAGDNLQENLEKKENIFAILGGLLELKEMMQNQEFHIDLLANKGAELFQDKRGITS
ncbi:MAG: conjugal transfer protein TraD [Alphaproteobacteria bacterium]|nr:conjugal transfer protein TraD [Alphaproteobacteria bacterium]NCQ67110.1 conjugal transfer protein TraD [Alphaproteobacteria bacterium]NCT07707.1 conjugal transfer protein TraD [Alphaproteobacteria bacterium]